jgi:lysophospholipase L1-like esterase
VINKGVDGDDTDGILGRFQTDVIAHRPDAVVVLSGTNDFVLLDRAPETVLERYGKMAELSLCHRIRPVFLTPPLTDPAMARGRWNGDTDYEVCNARLRTLRGLMNEYGEAEKGRVQVIDLQACYTGGFVDGIHLTLEGHAQVAELLAGLCPAART